jgi:hypothetical protein
MLASPNTYEDSQIQSSVPIGTQAPIPSGIHDIELSWDRKKGYMRIIIDQEYWWFKEYLGKAQILGCDNERGRLYLRAAAYIDNETLIMYRDPDAKPHTHVEGTRRPETHNRLCYRRPSREWRLRDERLSWDHPDALVLTKSYIGDLNAEWHANDSIAHIYHNGYTIIDEDDVAHLYDPELIKNEDI